jgi:hypothetical protein
MNTMKSACHYVKNTKKEGNFRIIDKKPYLTMKGNGDKICYAKLVTEDGNPIGYYTDGCPCCAPHATYVYSFYLYFKETYIDPIDPIDPIDYTTLKKYRFVLPHQRTRLDSVTVTGKDLNHVRKVTLEIGTNRIAWGLPDINGKVTLMSAITDALPLDIMMYHETILIVDHDLVDGDPEIQFVFPEKIDHMEYENNGKVLHEWYYYHDGGISDFWMWCGMSFVKEGHAHFPHLFFKDDAPIPEKLTLDDLVDWLNQYSVKMFVPFPLTGDTYGCQYNTVDPLPYQEMNIWKYAVPNIWE